MSSKASLLVLLALLAVPFAVGGGWRPGVPEREVVFDFADRAIVESSGLAVVDGLFATTNDSGDTGRVFAVSDTGRTVGVTTWSDEPADVEALAPAGAGQVWVGDIGDNAKGRDSVSVTRVPIGRGSREVAETSYELIYPDGARDAEALLRHPRTGRLYVVSKVVFGGSVYAAPAALDAGKANPLRPIGEVTGLVTDGAFFPDGRHVVLRTYSRAVVYTFPGLESVGDVELPSQEQGEGLAVAGPDSFYLSSEGVGSPVLRVVLPEQIGAAMSAAPPGDRQANRPDRNPSIDPAADVGDRDTWHWWLGGGIMIVLVITLLRALRPR